MRAIFDGDKPKWREPSTKIDVSLCYLCEIVWKVLIDCVFVIKVVWLRFLLCYYSQVKKMHFAQ